MRTMSRYEFKYLLSHKQYRSVYAAVQAHMKQDPFTEQAGYYWVRSLYLDSPDYRAYWEKVNGDSYRAKVRLRTYAQDLSMHAPTALEIKTKIGDRTDKFSWFVDCQDPGEIHNLVQSLDPEASPVIRQFLRFYHRQTLRPKVLVQYRREGYRSRDPDDVRITFDHQVESAAANGLFPAGLFLRPHHRHWSVLEIKTPGMPPPWLRRLILRHGLRVQKNSKYAQAVENNAHDVAKSYLS